MIDLDECILYFTAEAYYDNMDWPGTNVKNWRERTATGNTTLKVYDVLGREVADLYSGRCQPGVYVAAFDGSDLASGVYLYRLSVDGPAETRRLILMK